MMTAPLLIVGLGSPHGDDQVGWLVIDEIAQLLAGSICRKAVAPSELLDWLGPCGCIEICDAIKSTDPIGTIKSWTWPAQELGGIAFVGTHDLSLVAMLHLAERIGRLPPSVRLWGVAISQTRPFEPASSDLLERVPRIARRVVKDIIRA
jgi:hydrogenase maturation protease